MLSVEPLGRNRMSRQRNLADQQQRLSEATWKVLTERGLAGLTIRAVAERAGCTTGLVMHAFPTKQALLLHARDLLHERTRVRAEEVEAAALGRAIVRPLGATHGPEQQFGATQEPEQPFGATHSPEQQSRAALEAVLLDGLALDAAGVEEARVWVSFLAAALADPVLAERHRAGNRSFVARVTRLLGSCRPEWDADLVDAEARSLVALAEGMNTLGAADPDTYPPEVQRRALADALTRALGPAAPPGLPPATPPAELRQSAPSAPEVGHFGATRRSTDGSGHGGEGRDVGLRIREFDPGHDGDTGDTGDTEAVVALWHACGLTRPWNDPHRDIARKLTVQPDLFLVGTDDTGRVIATAMAGYDGHRGWVNYLAVDPSRQGRRTGRALMSEIERRLLQLGCPKINLQIRRGNEPVMEFYRALGYTEDAAASFGKRLIPDDRPMDA
jgi:AcrR family transcriptional regulator/GNAT superfamily N-acetyltransferase